MANYPDWGGPTPVLFTEEHTRMAEDALRQLVLVNAILQKCEKCKIPTGEIRKDCDGLCDFFTNFLAEQRGDQAPITAALG